MIDTITMVIHRAEIEQENLIKHLLQQLKKYRVDNNNSTLYANVDNMTITANEERLIITGSLCKFYHGNNIETLTRAETATAFSRLSDVLNMDVGVAKITRIDLATNITTSNAVNSYFPMFGMMGRLERKLMPTSLYYQSKDFVFTIYDKVEEIRSKGGDIQNIYNLMRIESRYKRRLKSQLGNIRCCDLYKREWFNYLVDKWRNDYYKIKKINNIAMTNELDFSTKGKDFINLCVFRQVEQYGGIAKAEAEIKENCKRGIYTKSQGQDLRSSIRRAYKAFEGCSNDLKISEIDGKVDEFADSIIE